MKYEPVFGDQSLFDGAPDDCCMVYIDEDGDNSCFYKVVDCVVWFKFYINDDYKKLMNTGHPTNAITAMRRIIAEPKRWTVEDQKAGRLPEVDWVVRATGMNEDARIAAINNDSVCVVFEDGAFVTLHVSGIAPIEAPEEKAKREEDEFAEYMVSKPSPAGCEATPFRCGLIAAYRELKGGA